MRISERIRRTLERALAPQRLEVVDESHLHVGHAGARPGGESHFRVEIVAQAFADKSRVERQRLVYDLLAGELAEGLHALSLSTRTPEEEARRRGPE